MYSVIADDINGSVLCKLHRACADYRCCMKTFMYEVISRCVVCSVSKLNKQYTVRKSVVGLLANLLKALCLEVIISLNLKTEEKRHTSPNPLLRHM